MPQEVILVLLVLVVCLVAALKLWAWTRRRRPRAVEAPPKPTDLVSATDSVSPRVPTPDLSGALARTRMRWWSGLKSVLGRSSESLQANEWEALEESLLAADVSLSTAQHLIKAVQRENPSDILAGLKSQVVACFEQVSGSWEVPLETRPWVISLVGVNGVGKTTTAGKLAFWLSQERGKRVLLGACDTFRAAATQQLQVWSERAGCEFVSGREGADPGATAYDAVAAGQARDQDVVLLDTAGRLHTKTHLMDELARVHKVVKKVISSAPHEVWLVVDGTLGQNSVVQARQFNEALGLTGVIVTKLDGTAKGGAVLSIAKDLKLPVRFIGVGEGAEALMAFDPVEFSNALFDN